MMDSPDFARERLPLVHIFLAESFIAVSKNFVEENRRGAAGEQRRPGKWFHERRFHQTLPVRRAWFFRQPKQLRRWAGLFGSAQSKL